MDTNIEKIDAKSLTSRHIDFWLLGGLSILLWFILAGASLLRSTNSTIDQRFLQIGILFTALTLVCNHPHFMVSYKLGYSKGSQFIFRNWLQLILVPSLLALGFIIAFLNYNYDLDQLAFVKWLNSAFYDKPYSDPIDGKLGPKIISLSIWLMYLTVGWHYAKQVFGCMMAYSRYDRYSLSKMDRMFIKLSLFSVAVYQFIYISRLSYQSNIGSGRFQDSRFAGIPLIVLDFPDWCYYLSILAIPIFSGLATFVMVKKYFAQEMKPSANFLVPWIAFHLWWVPVINLPEYYFLAIPFFHSLQYLPFAFKREVAKQKGKSHYVLRSYLVVAAILFSGFFFFEFFPGFLDRFFDVQMLQVATFFTITFAVFINVHHFFIDSVIWRLSSDPEVQKAILE